MTDDSIAAAGALTPPVLSLEPGLEQLCLLGLVVAEPVVVGPAGAELIAEFDRLAAQLGKEYAGREPSEIPGLAPARRLYRTFGVDPTRTRPSSEALLRRILQGKPLPRILNAVDVCNLCSLSFLLPIGLYDRDKIRGRVVLRRGTAGEAYQGIRKDSVGVEGRPVLADDAGAFGNPSSDSLRTCVDNTTRRLFMVIFAPHEAARPMLAAHVDEAIGAMTRHLGPPGTVRAAGAVHPQG